MAVDLTPEFAGMNVLAVYDRCRARVGDVIDELHLVTRIKGSAFRGNAEFAMVLNRLAALYHAAVAINAARVSKPRLGQLELGDVVALGGGDWVLARNCGLLLAWFAFKGVSTDMVVGMLVEMAGEIRPICIVVSDLTSRWRSP